MEDQTVDGVGRVADTISRGDQIIDKAIFQRYPHNFHDTGKGDVGDRVRGRRCGAWQDKDAGLMTKLVERGGQRLEAERRQWEWQVQQ